MRAVVGLLLLLAASVCNAQAPGAATCPPGARSPALDAARAELAKNERALESRLEFADALLAQGCYGEAVHVLEEGEAIHSRNGGIQSRLRDARSMLSEQRYFDGLDRAAEAARIERNLLRCRQLGDLTACDEALKAKPDDAGILGSKADALMKGNRAAEAVPVYQRALEIDPSDADLQTRAKAAETKRLERVTECLNGRDDAALEACNVAQLRGASDEFSVQARKAILLQGMGQSAQALDAYIAAGSLKPDDKGVASGIVALTESTGRQDAVALSARGNALLTLGRGTDAVRVLKQAQQLSPTLPDLKLHLAAAEKLARVEARKKAEADAAAAKEQAELASAAAAAATPPETPAARTYSNQGPASRSH
jgi:tetratricopeptide (TPR) repeat protein